MKDYRSFLKGERGYVYPVRKERILVARELPPFFEKARFELERLLKGKDKQYSVTEVSPQEKILHEFHLLGHGKTGTNKAGKLTGWSGDMPCKSYEKEDKLQLGGIELALAQEGIMPEDIDLRKLAEKTAPVDLQKYSEKFVGDLPRQMGHALLLSGKHAEFYFFKDRVDREIAASGNIFDKSIYQDMMDLCLDIGWIPTPLLRAQYYGPMELYPEKLEEGKKREFVEEVITRTKLNYEKAKLSDQFDEDQARKEADMIASALIQRKDLLFAQRKEGHIITEDRLDLTHRLESFYKSAMDNIKGKMLVITSSGCIDISPSIFRYFETKSKYAIETPKKKVRGKVVEVKFGEIQGRPCYLNDDSKLNAIREETKGTIAELRSRSIDLLIREEDKGILETPLVGFKKVEESSPPKYESYSVEFKSVIQARQPIIIFGHGGQGKSILATVIAKRFLDGSFGETYAKFIPVMINCSNMANQVKLNMDSYGEPRLYDLVTEPIQSANLTQTLLNDYGFVYIVDDYQKLPSDYTGDMDNAVHRLRDEGNILILLSRLEKSDVKPPHNPEYETIQIDTDRVAKDIDAFIEDRIPDGDKGRFKSYVSLYDSSITGYYLTKLFLTMIFPKENGHNTGVARYILDPAIQEAVQVGSPLTATQLYDAHTDYVCGCDIERVQPGIALTQVRRHIADMKDALAKKAYQEVFGQ